jgi:hypothetical protein
VNGTADGTGDDFPAGIREHAQDDAMDHRSPDAAVPLILVRGGEPTPEELAALLAVLAARTATSGDPGTPAPAPAFAGYGPGARRYAMRRPLTPGPDGWRQSRWNLGGTL